MPSLQTLQSETFEVVLLEHEDDPLIASVYRNKKTRSAREQLRENMKGVHASLLKAHKETEKIQAEVVKIDKGQQIEDKRREIETLEEESEEDAPSDVVKALRIELNTLEAEQEKARPRLEKLMEEIAGKIEKAEDLAHETVARQLSHFIKSTNLRESDEPDSPLVPATLEFWQDTFDYETLTDFADRIAKALDGPLGMRQRSTS